MTPTFTLSETQRAAIHKMERDSFLEYCRRSKRTEQAATADVLASLRKDIELILADPRSESSRGWYEDLLEMTDVFHVAKRLHDIERMICIDSIVELQPSIDVAYLADLARAIGATPPISSRPDTLRSFLNEIPTIMLWDTDFNAFVEHRSTIGSLPCICVYHHLELALMCFVDVMMTVIFADSPNDLRLLNRSDIDTNASSESFMESSRQVIGLLFGTAYKAELPPKDCFRIRQPELAYEFNLVTMGSQQFVWFHEFGHLLKGHLTEGPSHKAELDADLFATIMVLGLGVKNPIVQSHLALGMTITLFALCVLEVGQPTNSQTHPPANERLCQFLSVVGKHFGFLNGVVERLEAACNPALRKYWSGSVTCDLTTVNSWL